MPRIEKIMDFYSLYMEKNEKNSIHWRLLNHLSVKYVSVWLYLSIVRTIAVDNNIDYA
jgi:hypothetical protein